MTLPKELLELLACPRCKGRIEYHREESRIVCPNCRLSYPVRDGIPIMLIDEATPA